MREEIVIWGAGAIGGTIGAYLQRAGIPVVFVDNVPEHIKAINRNGLRITGPIEAFTIKAPAYMPDDLPGRYDTVFLCVKALHTEIACCQIGDRLGDGGCVVSLQNGLNERVIARVFGSSRTVGAFINFGADYHGPGEVHYGGRGAVVIGEIDGEITPRVNRLHRHLLNFEDKAIITPNIMGFLWGKMSYGALLYATALTNASIVDVLASTRHRPCLTALAQEVLKVATAEKIIPEKFDGYDPTAFLGTDTDQIKHSFEDMVIHNRKSTKTHSGIWRDLPRESRLFANEILQGAPRIISMIEGELKALVDEKVRIIEGWMDEGKLVRVDPYHLLFSIWATTQHYADFDVQVRTMLGPDKDGEARFEDAAKFLNQLFVHGLMPGK